MNRTLANSFKGLELFPPTVNTHSRSPAFFPKFMQLNMFKFKFSLPPR